MIPRRLQIGILAALLAVLGYRIYSGMQTNEVQSAPPDATQFVPLPVENPALRLDLLERVKQFEYEGTRRNIFSLAPSPRPEASAPPEVVRMPDRPASPPPVMVPAQFFGQVTDLRTGTRRAFFSEGEDVYVVGIGDVLLGRFRLLSLGNTTAELEELASGRRATLTMEEPSPL